MRTKEKIIEILKQSIEANRQFISTHPGADNYQLGYADGEIQFAKNVLKLLYNEYGYTDDYYNMIKGVKK